MPWTLKKYKILTVWLINYNSVIYKTREGFFLIKFNLPESISHKTDSGNFRLIFWLSVDLRSGLGHLKYSN